MYIFNGIVFTANLCVVFHRQQHPVRGHLRTQVAVRRGADQAHGPEQLPSELYGQGAWRLRSDYQVG